MQDFWNTCCSAQLVNEADVELQIVIPLLKALGYEQSDIASKFPVTFREGRKGRKPEADFVCFNGKEHNKNTSLLVIEAKPPTETLAEGKEQGESYAANLRAPVLLVTNGVRMEAWQIQTTKESEKIVDIAVSDLTAHQGILERLLSKQTLISLCERLGIRSMEKASIEFAAYESAELLRVTNNNESIHRTLRSSADSGKKEELCSQALLAACPSGAIILAPSGHGKSTLAKDLIRQALEKRADDSDGALPFLVPLTAINGTTGSLLEFLQQRLSAHCPGVSLAALKDMLRESGAIVLGDAFDRVGNSSRAGVETELSNLVRDFPRVQLLLFSRKSSQPDTHLPAFTLMPPSDMQLRELESLVLGKSRQSHFVFSMMSKTLRNICENILVSRLVLDYWKEYGEYPLELGSLFRAWIKNLLQQTAASQGTAVWLESALGILAEATIGAPIAMTAAASLLREHSFDPAVLNQLVERDAIRLDGTLLEIQHEALADYLRARHLSMLPEPELLAKLSAIRIPKDSLYPTLLMSQLNSSPLQSALWKRFTETSLIVYLDALRYRFDLSASMEKLDSETLSREYLGDVLAGVDVPLETFFPKMRSAVLRYLTLQDQGELGITGTVYSEPSKEVAYGFRSAVGGDRVTVYHPHLATELVENRYVHLNRSGYRLDSGRLLGTERLRDTLLKLIENQELAGGPHWLSERLIGHIWHLQRSGQLAIDVTQDLTTLGETLQPHAGRWVVSGDRERDWYSVDSMLRDIEVLRGHNLERLDLWWTNLGWVEGNITQEDSVIKNVISEYYRRQQIVLAEVIECTFPVLAQQMSCYSCLPARWKIDVVKSSSFGGPVMLSSWLPVVRWEDAGADVALGDEVPSSAGDDRIGEALKNLKRPSNRYMIGGRFVMPSFDGRDWAGRLLNKTAVVFEVCSLLEKEIEYLFSALPSHDFLGGRIPLA